MKNQRKQDVIRTLQQVDTQLCAAVTNAASALREAKELGLMQGAFGADEFSDAPIEQASAPSLFPQPGGGTNLKLSEFMALVGALDSLLGFAQGEDRPTQNHLPAMYAAKLPGS